MLSWKQYLGIWAVLICALVLPVMAGFQFMAYWHAVEVTSQRLDAVTRAHSLATSNLMIARADGHDPAQEFSPLSREQLPLSTRVVAVRDGKEQVLFEHELANSSELLQSDSLDDSMVEQFHLEDWAGNDRKTRVSVDIKSLPLASAVPGSFPLAQFVGALIGLAIGSILGALFSRLANIRPRSAPKRWVVALYCLIMVPVALFMLQASVSYYGYVHYRRILIRQSMVSEIVSQHLCDREPDAVSASEKERIEQVCLQAGLYARATSPTAGVNEFGEFPGESALTADRKLAGESGGIGGRVEVWRVPKWWYWSAVLPSVIFGLLFALWLQLFWPLFKRLNQSSVEYWERRDAWLARRNERAKSAEQSR